MISRVPIYRALRIVVAGMLLTTVVSGTALAKNPSNNLSGTATAVPGTVSAAALVRFNYSVTNTSSSNFSSFFVDAVTPNTDFDAALVAVISVGNSTSGTTPTCDTTSGDLHCTFGPLNSGKTATINVVYRTPSNASGTWSVLFAASSTGAPGTDPGNSHGDAYNVTGTVNIGVGKAGGSYIYGTNLSAQNDQNLGRRNAQSARLLFSSAGANGFPATLDEAPASSTTYVCPNAVASACFGDWNLISADSGAIFANGYTLTLGYDKIAGQQGDVRFVHLLDPDHDGIYGESQVAGTDYVVIPSFNSQPCSTSFPLNCIDSISSTNGDYFFTLLLDNNGPMRGI